MGASGLTYTLPGQEIDALFKNISRGVESFGEDADSIAQLLENSIRRNFIEGGRPAQWTPSKRAEDDSGQTLRDTNRLMNSIVGYGSDRQVTVGTNVEYAAAHNFGVNEIITQQVRAHTRMITQAFGRDIGLKEVEVRAHERTVPLHIEQREFMLVQDEDWDDIKDILSLRINRLVTGE